MATNAFTYADSLAESEIRLLLIEASADKTAPICSRLVRTNIEKPCSYEAVSYTWSDREDGQVIFERTIVCDSQQLWVTKSAHDALTAFRLSDRNRALWIDAICINQKDDLERTQQVSIMARVYSAAAGVLIWLGPDSQAKDAFHAMCCLRGAGLANHWLRPRFGTRNGRDPEGFHEHMRWCWLVGRWEVTANLSKSEQELTEQLQDFGDYSGGRWAHVRCPLVTYYHGNVTTGYSGIIRTALNFVRQWWLWGLHCCLSDPPSLYYSPALALLKTDGWYDLDPLMLEHGHQLPEHHRLLQHILEFLQLRWFSRRWILQEAMLGQNVTVRCGDHEINTRTLELGLEAVCSALEYHSMPCNLPWQWPFHRAIQVMQPKPLQMKNKKRTVTQKVTEHPCSIMYRYDDFKCSDAKDRIYALLSLFEESIIAPDYTISVPALYFNFAKACLDYRKGIALVLWQAAGRCPSPLRDADSELKEVLPSWIPDWRRPIQQSADRGSYNSEGRYLFGSNIFSGNAHINDDRTLTISGCWLAGPLQRHHDSTSMCLGHLQEPSAAAFDRQLSFLCTTSACNTGPIDEIYGEVEPGDAVLALSARGFDFQYIIVRCVDAVQRLYQVIGWCVDKDGHFGDMIRESIETGRLQTTDFTLI